MHFGVKCSDTKVPRVVLNLVRMVVRYLIEFRKDGCKILDGIRGDVGLKITACCLQ